MYSSAHRHKTESFPNSKQSHNQQKPVGSGDCKEYPKFTNLFLVYYEFDQNFVLNFTGRSLRDDNNETVALLVVFGVRA